ncbi:hypothetical protein [Rubidibacter lacunae]|uniref:hypothetical protein n=1 Tax=Rubidibacter lacunae TaxID=582514 RepID=UPI0012EB12A8|nr:hypothetical protein [Rubidibacter lacunae]
MPSYRNRVAALRRSLTGGTNATALASAGLPPLVVPLSEEALRATSWKPASAAANQPLGHAQLVGADIRLAGVRCAIV